MIHLRGTKNKKRTRRRKTDVSNSPNVVIRLFSYASKRLSIVSAPELDRPVVTPTNNPPPIFAVIYTGHRTGMPTQSLDKRPVVRREDLDVPVKATGDEERTRLLGELGTLLVGAGWDTVDRVV